MLTGQRGQYPPALAFAVLVCRPAALTLATWALIIPYCLVVRVFHVHIGVPLVLIPKDPGAHLHFLTLPF